MEQNNWGVSRRDITGKIIEKKKEIIDPNEKRFLFYARDGKQGMGVINYKQEKEKSQPQVVVGQLDINEYLLAHINAWKHEIGVDVDRKAGDKILKYHVIDGETIRAKLPYFWHVGVGLQKFAEELYGQPLVPLHDKAAVNINVVGPGGEQGFHTDRNEVTILLYLSNPKGGELEYQAEDGTIVKVHPHIGAIAGLIGANKIMHRVTPVESDSKEERIALVASFGLPGKNYETSKRDDFLYTAEKNVTDQEVFKK